jgi:hypothetical protein
MNTRIIYAVGGGIIIIGVVFYLFFNFGFMTQNPSLNDPLTPALNTNQSTSTESNQVASVSDEHNQLSPQQLNNQNLSLSVNSVRVVPINDELRVEVSFNAYNPNRGAAILETVSYNVYLDNVRIGSGDVGTRTEGFVDSLESVYTLIGNQTIVLRDREPLTEEASTMFDSQGNLTDALSDNSSSLKEFDINGTYFYTLNRGSDAQVREHSFNSQYPLVP